jgi:hypothetical protein
MRGAIAVTVAAALLLVDRASAAPGTATADPFQFELLPAAPTPPVDPGFAAKVRRRRQMLGAHQVLGVLTMISLAGTLVLGQLNIVDKFGGGVDGRGATGDFRIPHAAFAGLTSTLFVTTGALALFAPEPYPKKTRFDSALVHKAAMLLATVAMVTEVALGIASSRLDGQLVQRDLATAHQVIGYSAFGLMGVGIIAYAF